MNDEQGAVRRAKAVGAVVCTLITNTKIPVRIDERIVGSRRTANAPVHRSGFTPGSELQALPRVGPTGVDMQKKILEQKVAFPQPDATTS